MKSLPFAILLGILIVSGCTEKHLIAKLTLIDSLMQNHSDSAYLLLKKINPGKINRYEQRAEYALLFFQAKLNRYEKIKSDSLINIAVSYYAGRDRLKYFKSLTFKGLALSDMGLPFEAMKWYKLAEKYAVNSDYKTLGLLNVCIGNLYQYSYSNSFEQVAKYKKALHYFKRTNDVNSILYCLSSIGQAYSTKNIDSAYFYQHKAIQLAKLLKDSSKLFSNYTVLSRIYYLDNKFRNAKDMALYVIKRGGKHLTNDDCYLNASSAYARLGMVDSAMYYYYKTQEAAVPAGAISKLLTLFEIDKAKGDYREALKHYQRSLMLKDSLRDFGGKLSMSSTEKYFAHTSDEIAFVSHEKERMNTTNIVVLVMVMILMFAGSAVYWVRRKRRRVLREMLIKEQIEKEPEGEVLENPISESNAYSSIIDSKLKVINELIEVIYRYGTNPPKLMNEYGKILNVKHLDEGVMRDLQELTNIKYCSVLEKIKTEHPVLTDDDIMLIAMVCNRFPVTVMTVFFGYCNEKSVYNRKSRIAAKMGLTTTLDCYLNERINSCIKKVSN